jgi:GDP-L-fucose synthase
VNPSNSYGTNDNYGANAHVIPSLIRKFSEARVTSSSPVVWGDGSAVREFIYSDDVASAIDAVIQGWESPEVISIGTGLSHSIRELVSALTEVSGLDLEVKWDASQPVGIPRKTFDVSKLKSLGWSPKVSLHEGLSLAWNDFHSVSPRGL